MGTKTYPVDMNRDELYELRRLDLLDLKKQEKTFRVIGDKANIDPGYLGRCAYPHGKKGKKNIADTTLLKLDEAFLGWRKRELDMVSEAFSNDAAEAIELAKKFISPSMSAGNADIDLWKDIQALIAGPKKEELKRYIQFLKSDH